MISIGCCRSAPLFDWTRSMFTILSSPAAKHKVQLVPARGMGRAVGYRPREIGSCHREELCSGREMAMVQTFFDSRGSGRRSPAGRASGSAGGKSGLRRAGRPRREVRDSGGKRRERKVPQKPDRPVSRKARGARVKRRCKRPPCGGREVPCKANPARSKAK